MGASSSTPSEEELADAALYTEDSLAALRACYKALAVPSGAIPAAASFQQLHGSFWPQLFQVMCQLDQPSSSDGPLRWPGFLAGVTRICKAPKSQRVKMMANAYSEAFLTGDALLRLLRDVHVAARAGNESDVAMSFEGVLADVCSGGGSSVPPERWVQWVALHLPALPATMEAFVLEQLCALGRAAARGGGGAAAGPDPAALRAAMRPFHEPLLELPKGQDASLLDDEAAFLLGMAIGPNTEGETRAWRCLYASAAHGLSMNRFAAHSGGYAGPTILLARTERGEVFGAYVDAPWKPGDKYFGGGGTFLFTLAPTFHVYRATAIASNYVFFRPPATGQLRGTSYLTAASLPEVVGFGGQPIRLRLGLEDDLNQLRWHRSDTTFAAHPEEAGELPEGTRRVLALELWGCGGADAEAARQLLRQRAQRDAARAGKVDRKVMFGGGGDWRNGDNPDKLILEAAGAHTFYSDQLEKLPPDQPQR